MIERRLRHAEAYIYLIARQHFPQNAQMLSRAKEAKAPTERRARGIERGSAPKSKAEVRFGLTNRWHWRCRCPHQFCLLHRRCQWR